MATTRLFIYPISILFALLLFCDHALAQESIWYGCCVGISDGDTIKVLTAAKQQIRVRIALIDAPQMGQAFGQRAELLLMLKLPASVEREYKREG